MSYYSNDWRLTHQVYALINPLDGRIFYVGKTFMGADIRLAAHITEAKTRSAGKNERKNELIESILRCGLTPETKILAEVKGTCKADAYMIGQLELNYIRDMAKEGHPLVNVRGIKDSTYYHWGRYLNSKERGILDLEFYESFVWNGYQYHDLISIDQNTGRLRKIPKEGSLAFFLRYGESRYSLVDNEGMKFWFEHEFKMAQ